MKTVLASAGPVRPMQMADEVAMRLRLAIMSGALRPGMFIRLDETAASLGTSITPVREALRTLLGEGLVQLKPHRGHVVAPLGHRDLEDLFWLHSALAAELAASVAETMTKAQIDQLQRLTDVLAEAVYRGDIHDVVEAELAFQREFHRDAGRVVLASMLENVARCIPMLIYADHPTWCAETIEHHLMLIDALRRRDAKTAAALARSQYRNGSNRLATALEGTQRGRNMKSVDAQ
jgi:DNA-binding GntR family transcriptional regulator